MCDQNKTDNSRCWSPVLFSAGMVIAQLATEFNVACVALSTPVMQAKFNPFTPKI